MLAMSGRNVLKLPAQQVDVQAIQTAINVNGNLAQE
jgi:hypothetical protein